VIVWWYARLPAPQSGRVFIDRLAERYGLGDSGRLLHLGCGTGRLTLPLPRASPKRSAWSGSIRYHRGRRAADAVIGRHLGRVGRAGSGHLDAFGRAPHEAAQARSAFRQVERLTGPNVSVAAPSGWPGCMLDTTRRRARNRLARSPALTEARIAWRR